MNPSAHAVDLNGVGALTHPERPALLAAPRTASAAAIKLFWLWTLFWWGGVGVFAGLFYFGVLDFATSTKIPLYGISIWLNGCLWAWLKQTRDQRTSQDIIHDGLVIWMLSYALTNLLWEIPWLVCSPFVFQDLHSLDDVVAHTEFMRSNLGNMYWWILASFSAVDLRTVNHNPTFYTLEIYAFVNLASTFYFFYLNKKRSPYRYLIPILSCGEPVASTFIFSFSEVMDGFRNMPGGTADTLLALVWTQYQYVLFPLLFATLSVKLFLHDMNQATRTAP